VIDALDECAETIGGFSNRNAFIKTLVAVPKLKLFITSRNFPSIRNILPGAVELPIVSQLRDIESYIEWRIENNDKLSAQVKAMPSLRDEISGVVKGRYPYMYVAIFLLERSTAESLQQNPQTKTMLVSSLVVYLWTSSLT
jgi:hypothetical protein